MSKKAEIQQVQAGTARDQWMVLKTLSKYLWPEGQNEIKLRVASALFCLALAKIANVYVPILFSQAVDILATKSTTDIILALPISLLLSYGLLRVLTIAFAELRDAIFAKVGQRAIRTVALQTFKHLHRLSLRFHLERQTGGLSRSIERGTKGIDFLLNFMLFNIIPTLLEILLVCGILWGLFDFWYAFVTFVTITSYICFTVIVTEWRLKFRRQMNETDNTANTRAIDSLINYETVKYFGNEAFESGRFDKALANYESAAVKSKTSLSLLNIGQSLIIGGGLTIILIMAGNGVAQSKLSVGDFVLVNTYLIQLYLPLNFLGYVYREIKQSIIDMEAMFSLLEVDCEVLDNLNAGDLKAGSGEINFENVSFGYDERRPILHDISFSVLPGTKTAIVGPSGSGKTTISRLLFRFYDVSGGAIKIDGQDIRSVTQASVREAIGIVPQDTVLFNDTIAYNIEYGFPGCSEQSVVKAAKSAAIHNFILSTPDQYQTMVGERGLKLSGGEKQRVSIARTILKDPRIFLFDEATSSLDSLTEKEIQKSLNQISLERTTLVIAHRLSTIIDADEIIVLEAGRIAERGQHDQLLAYDGVYASMWLRQQQEERKNEQLID